MEIISLSGNDPLEFRSKALENSLHRLQDSAARLTEEEDLRKVSRELDSKNPCPRTVSSAIPRQ